MSRVRKGLLSDGNDRRSIADPIEVPGLDIVDLPEVELAATAIPFLTVGSIGPNWRSKFSLRGRFDRQVWRNSPYCALSRATSAPDSSNRPPSVSSHATPDGAAVQRYDPTEIDSPWPNGSANGFQAKSV